jgi:hypothetical protein
LLELERTSISFLQILLINASAVISMIRTNFFNGLIAQGTCDYNRVLAFTNVSHEKHAGKRKMKNTT